MFCFVLQELPKVGLVDIFNYLVMSSAQYDKEHLRSYKAFEDYALFRFVSNNSFSLNFQPYFIWDNIIEK